ncbi:hypothetical protein ACMD2_26025 [Ananas comosus]|uniref:Uncharacterized protein n=1 Tax=Ananas comosus TaxID=4615 RepID=A0A199UR35_ANACO|nr:hypothetical protein ACMD2_26025 [Ananas comosus]
MDGGIELAIDVNVQSEIMEKLFAAANAVEMINHPFHGIS